MPRGPSGPRMYFTQCDGGDAALRSIDGRPQCTEVARLAVAKRWRCRDCVKEFGPLITKEE